MTPTDRTRERTLARLRDGYACGTLGTQTLDRRIDVALRARTREELAGLTTDLPAVSSRWDWARRVLRRPAAPALAPAPATPGGLLATAEHGTGELTLGRSPRSQIVLTDDTVSRRHALLRRREDRGYVVDLGSSNGTWLGERRVYDAGVRPGDELRLGQVRLRL